MKFARACAGSYRRRLDGEIGARPTNLQIDFLEKEGSLAVQKNVSRGFALFLAELIGSRGPAVPPCIHSTRSPRIFRLRAEGRVVGVSLAPFFRWVAFSRLSSTLVAV